MKQRKAPLARGMPPRPSRRPIPRESKKHAKQHARRADVLIAVRLRDGPGCWAQRSWPHRCWGPLDGHEVIPRDLWKDGWLVESNVRLVCRASHIWITDNVADATALGLLGNSWDR